MQDYLAEINNNFSVFDKDWRNSQKRISKKLSKSHNSTYYIESYKRIISLQAWRTCFLEQQIDEASLGFFLEAQNDALMSLVLAQQGIWRSSLKSLRSVIDNILFCIYYMDHPVEHRLWNNGKKSPTMSFFFEYLKKHPDLRDVSCNINGIEIMENEWRTLSRAVHGSAKSFRMTAQGKIPSLFSSAIDKVGAWSTRESKCLLGVNLMLVSLFKEHLQGAKMRNLRKAISLVILKAKHASIKSELNIHLYDF